MSSMTPTCRFLVVLLTLVCSVVSAGERSIKVLTIGNSFANNALKYLPEIGASQGVAFTVGRANIGGGSLARHARHLTAAESDADGADANPYADGEGRPKTNLPVLLQRKAWDFVTIQQASFHSFDEGSFEPHATRLIEVTQTLAPTAEIMVHQIWAYREDDPWFTGAAAGDGVGVTQPISQEEMHRRLVKNYDALAERHGLRLLPVGEAFRNARDLPEWTFSWPDPKFDYRNPADGAVPRQPGSLNVGWRWAKDSKTGAMTFGIDGHHANLAGCYLAGLVWFEMLVGVPPAADVWHPEELSDVQALALMRAAHLAVKARTALR